MTSRPIMSWINLGEVLYVVAHRAGMSTAMAVLQDLRRRVTPDEATPDRVVQAASLKAEHPMAFGDAFAVATAQAHTAVLLTGDPEILEASAEWALEDLR